METKANPHLRLAQKALAVEMTNIIHGKEMSLAIQEVAELLFSSKKFDISNDALTILRTVIKTSDKEIKTIYDLKQAMVETELVGSMTQATQAIKDNAVSLLELKKESIKVNISSLEFELNKPFLIKKGKKSFALII